MPFSNKVSGYLLKTSKTYVNQVSEEFNPDFIIKFAPKVGFWSRLRNGSVVRVTPVGFGMKYFLTTCRHTNTSRVTESNNSGSGNEVIHDDMQADKHSSGDRFCHDIFDRDYKATIGVDFEVEKFSILSMPFNLQIWDTAGQERFKCIAAAYYRGAQAVVATFDMSNTFSLENTRRWMEDACENASDPLRFLVGSKKDLVSEEVFMEMEDRAKRVAEELGAEYWPCSSKTGENVREVFFRIATLTFENAVIQEVEKNKAPVTIGTIKLDRNNPDKFQRTKKGPLSCCNN